MPARYSITKGVHPCNGCFPFEDPITKSSHQIIGNNASNVRCAGIQKGCQGTLRTVFRYDLVSGSEITYDHLTDGIMWAQGLFSDSVKIIALAPFNIASWSFS